MLAAVGTDAVTGLVWNSRQAKTKLSATLVSSFYRLWTAEQRRAATPRNARRKRIFTGISIDRQGIGCFTRRDASTIFLEVSGINESRPIRIEAARKRGIAADGPSSLEVAREQPLRWL